MGGIDSTVHIAQNEGIGLTPRSLWQIWFLLFISVCSLIANPATALAQNDVCAPPADLDNSGLVDIQDVSLIAGHWHQPLDDPRYDLDDDGDVDVVDVMLVTSHWGETGSPLPQLPGDGLVWAAGSTRKIRPTDEPVVTASVVPPATEVATTNQDPVVTTSVVPPATEVATTNQDPVVTTSVVPPATEVATTNQDLVVTTSVVPQTNTTSWVWDGCRIRLHAARNETEPVQLVITAGTQPLTGVSVSVSDLTNGSGATIEQNQITLYREAYHTVSQPSDPYGYGLPAGTLDPGPIPDALIPFDDPYNPGTAVGAPFSVAAGQNQPIWIDLTVPEGTPAGTYQGTITVTTDEGSPLEVPLELVVWNFTLPAQPSLSINFTTDPLWTLPPQYDIPEWNTTAIYALTDKYYEALAAHRLGPMNLYRAPVVTETNGQVQLDWTPAASHYQHWLDTRDLPAFYIPDVYDGDNERYRIRKTNGTFYTQADFEDPVFVDKAKQYYAALRDDLQSRGWWDQAWTYPTDETEWVADEPLNNGLDGYQRLEAWAQLLKDPDLNYRIMTSSVYPVPVGPPDRGWPDLKGLVDDWNVVVQDADLNPALWASRQALGETLSFYHNDWGDFLDYKATLHRGLGWVAYKYGAWAVTGWAAMAWIGNADTGEIVNPWTSSVDPLFGYGGGALFWPGKTIEGDANKNVDGPLPSIRLKLAREAVEDHDYLALLAAQTSPDYARVLVRGLIPRDYWDWDPAPEAIYVLRDRIGRLLDSGTSVGLVTVQGQVTDAGSGAPIQDVFVTDGESGALADATGHYTLTVGLPATTGVHLKVGGLADLGGLHDAFLDQNTLAEAVFEPEKGHSETSEVLFGDILPSFVCAPTTVFAPASSVNLSFSAPRYQPASHTVEVSEGGSVTQNTTLTRVAEESRLLYSFETAGELDLWEFENTISQTRVSDHTTDGSYALKVVFNDSAFLARWLDRWPAAGVGTFPTRDWSSYTALEFDVYNEGDYYTYMEVGVADVGEGWYPQTGGTITLLPNQSHHVVIPTADIAASGVDLTRIEWIEIAPETIITGENSASRPAGPRTLYFDNLRLVRVESD